MGDTEDRDQRMEEAQRQFQAEADALAKALDEHIDTAEVELSKTNASEFVDRAMRRQLLTEQWVVNRLAALRTTVQSQQRTIAVLLQSVDAITGALKSVDGSLESLIAAVRIIDKRTRS